MSMNATDVVVRSSATFLATVDLPDPEPPAIPIIKWFQHADAKLRFRCIEMHYAPVGNKPEPLPKAELHENPNDCFCASTCGRSACKTFSQGAGASDQRSYPTVSRWITRVSFDMNIYAVRSSQRLRSALPQGIADQSYDSGRARHWPHTTSLHRRSQ